MTYPLHKMTMKKQKLSLRNRKSWRIESDGDEVEDDSTEVIRMVTTLMAQ